MNTTFTALHAIIQKATQLHVANLDHYRPYDLSEVYEIPLPPAEGRLGELFQTHGLTFQERVILLVALAPHFCPQVLDIFQAKNPNFDTICTEFGGVSQLPHRGILPTGETVAFLLAGRDLQRRQEVARLLMPGQPLKSHQLVRLDTPPAGQPAMAGRLLADEELVQELMYGERILPQMSSQFPAAQIKTSMGWEDLILPESTALQLKDLEKWLMLQAQLMEHPTLGRRAQPGYRALFYGPPGTGKTLTASLLGKATRRPVFRIDLSMVVSKYIGETEKNLAQVFAKAEHKDWILFFDEADALFGKRTGGDSSNDRFANQEVAYLLQRIERFNGMAILASNLKQNIDPAFMRRFQSIVFFPAPRFPERVRIWEKTVPVDLPLAEAISMERLARNYELTAAQISNIVQGCFIEALSKGEERIERENLRKNMQRELGKEDLIFEVLF